MEHRTLHVVPAGLDLSPGATRAPPEGRPRCPMASAQLASSLQMVSIMMKVTSYGSQLALGRRSSM